MFLIVVDSLTFNDAILAGLDSVSVAEFQFTIP